MAYEQEKKFLAEEAAIRVSYWSNPQNGNAVLVRRWTTSRAELHASSVAYLNTIKTVTNPCAIADGKSKQYPGVWRVFPFQAMLGKGVPEDQQGITQTLVLTVEGDFKWASEDSTLECMYSYAYQNGVYPIQTALATQGIVTEAQNTLNDQLRYDSQARLIHSHPYQWATHVVENALGVSDDIGYKNSRSCPQSPASTVQGTVYDAKSTLNKDGSYDGDVAYDTSKAKETAAIVSESTLDVNYEAAYLNGRTRPVVPSTVIQGFVYDARSTVNKDDTYNGSAGYAYSKEAAWSDVTETVTGTSSGNSYLNYRIRPSAPSTVAIGFVYDAKLTLNKDGTYSGGVGYEYAKPAEWSDKVESALSTSLDYSYLNKRAKVSAPDTAAQGFLYDAKSTLNRDGTYNGGSGYEYSKPAMWKDETQTTTGISSGSSYLNYRIRPAAPTIEVLGFVYDAKTTTNKDGTYNGGVGYEYSKPAQWVDVTDAVMATSVGHSYLNQRTQPAAPSTLAQGFLYDGKSTLNRDGTYNGGVGYEYSKPDMWTDSTETLLSSSVSNSYLNYRTRPTAPAGAVQGFIYDVKTTDNKDGTYSGGVGYEYSKPDAWMDVSENALGVSVSNSYLNYRERPAAPASAVQGFIYDAKTTDNRDGTYSGGVGYEYSKPVEIAAQTASSTLAASYEVAYQNSRTKPVVPAATIGWTYDAKSTLAKDGTYNGGIGYDYAAPISSYVTWKTNGGVRGRWKYTNWNGVPSTIADLDYYSRNEVGFDYNPNGSANIEINSHPGTGVSILAGTVYYRNDAISSVKRRQYRGGYTEYRTVTITLGIYITNSKTDAYAYIDAHADGSRVNKDGNAYTAIKYSLNFSAWADISSEPNIPA